MRHAKRINHLGRTNTHRAAMLSNMACSLIIHKRITTTLAKAKALRKYVEPLITRSKEDTTHSRRMVFSYLQDKKAVTELYREISPKIANRPGGYTRILKTGFRQGDNAEMCMIEFVDYNETYSTGEGTKKAAKTRRSRKSTAKTAAAPISETTAVKETAPVVEEVTPEVEEPVDEVKEEVVEVETPQEEPAAEQIEEVVETPQEEPAPETSTDEIEEPKAE